MSPTPLPLVEYETRSGVELTPLQRDQLRRIAPSVGVAPTIGREGAYDLTPGSHVGAIRLDAGLELVIRPKVSIDRVLFLISYAVGLGQRAAQPSNLAEADSLLEAIVPAFTFRMRKALERGVLQGYRSEDAALTTVRGRWRIGDQIRGHYGLAPPVEVSYDDFTEDIEPNRQLRAALNRLVRLPLRDDRSRWPLRALDARLENVLSVEYDPHHLPSVAFDRRSEHYRGVVSFARLILSGVSFDLAAGAVAASAFLIDMNRVFEDFVVIALRDAMRVSDRVLVQGARGRPLFLDKARRVSLKPDVSYWSGERCLFVGDVKYKRIVPADFQHADLYQLLAYTIATRLESGTLIYAAGPEGGDAHEVQHLGKRLLVAPLDLRLAPDRILDQVRELASRIVPLT